MVITCGYSRWIQRALFPLKVLVAVAIFAVASFDRAASGGEDPIDAGERAGLVDLHLHLFVDDVEISHRERVARFINRPRKRPEPVLVADQPWEGDRAQAWGSVIQEPDGLLRMWYFSFNTERRSDRLDCGGYAYAESRDGIHWKKPALGVVEFRGSKQNNLFYTCAPDGKNLIEEELARRGLGLPAFDAAGKQLGVINNLDGLSVVKDDFDSDPQRRYKLVANMQDHRKWAPYYRDRYPKVTEAEVRQAESVSGQYMDTSPDGIHWTRRPVKMLPAHSDYMMLTRDYRQRRWWLNERTKGLGGRNAALRTSTDFKSWSKPEIIFDNDAETDHARLFEWHGGMTPFNYGNVNLGLLEKWPTGSFGANCELIVQRDGGRWQRVQPGTPFLDIGTEGAFDRALAYPTHNPPLRIGETLAIYYTGGGARQDPRKGIPMAIGLATVPLDRFAGLANWRLGRPGRIVTKPVLIDRNQLDINAELLEGEPVRVAVLGSDGKPLVGYSLDECQPQASPKSVYTRIRWKKKLDMAELRGQTVSLLFEFKGAVLYSYRLHGDPSIRDNK